MAQALICSVYHIPPAAVDRLIIPEYRTKREVALNIFAAGTGNVELQLLTSSDKYLADCADWERAKAMKRKWAKEKKVI